MIHQKYKTLLNGYHINTPLRLAHFLAQIDHESGGFKYLTELGNRSYFNKYEGRKDLGNTEVGDGFRFRGRGYIQVTGRYNYLQLSKDTGIDFVNNPDLLATEVNAIVSACWFWSKRKLNALADKDDLIGITRRVNGGLTGLEDRRRKLAKWKAIVK
jgi:putative chitinase